MSNEPATPSLEEQLSEWFGSYKAEWLKEHMFELFTEPSYFPELTTSRPCMLLGGRGTGKTTVLRCMSYEGQFVLKGRQAAEIPNWTYYGLYYRVNTNRVTAFTGPELDANKWQRVFAHYFNLICCDLVIHFLEWYYLYCPNSPRLSRNDCERVCASLHLPDAHDLGALAGRIADAQTDFEAYVNNIGDEISVRLSMQGAPIDTLLSVLQALPHFRGKNFFFLLDEYENLEDYQQQVINTLIKHSGQLYSFKIGVKELGWRCRTTLNANEQLISPADYVRIKIADKFDGERYLTFAQRVCNERIARLKVPEGKPLEIDALLPRISAEREAELLDEGSGLATQVARTLNEIADSKQKEALKSIPLLEKYFISYWASGHGLTLEEALKDYFDKPTVWDNRYHNYKHSALYTIKRGKAGIRKYYAGWEVLAHLSAGNIRYLLELVDQVLLKHVQSGGDLQHTISADVQTSAAQMVGKKNLSELEGLSVQGAQLTKLLLGLGRIFQTMAADPAGHLAEVSSFELGDPVGKHVEQEHQVKNLLTSAVMHLALVRLPGSKPADETDTRDYDYMVHPIFCAFFSFSYRRKRKITISSHQLIGLVNEPRKTIREILDASGREGDEPLPDQLQLFQTFYGTNS